MNQPFRLRYANIIVGLFTFGVLCSLVVMIAFTFRRGEYQSYELVVTEKEAGDLFQGAEVWMLGERAGSVTSLSYVGQTNQVRIEMAIKLSLVDQMKNVEIHLERKFGLGTPLLRIRRRKMPSQEGNLDDEPVRPIGIFSPSLMRPIAFHPAMLGNANDDEGVDSEDNGRRVGGKNETDRSDTPRLQLAPPRSPATNPSSKENEAVVQNDAVITLRSDDGSTSFVGENDRFDEISAQVKRVADSIAAIRDRTLPTLDKVGTSSTDLSSASTAVKDATDDLTPRAADTIQTIRDATQQFEKDVDAVTKSITSIVDKEIRNAVNEVKKSALATSQASKRAELAAEKAGLAADAVNQTSLTTGREIETTLSDLRKTSAEIRRLTRETLGVVRIVRDEAEDLPGTTDRVNDAVGETQDLVEQIQDHWLLRRSRRDDPPMRSISPSSLRVGGGY